MRQTILLLQLLILVFAGYAMYTFAEDIRLYVVLACLIAAYILEKTDALVLDRQKLQAVFDREQLEQAARKKKNTLLGTLMESSSRPVLRKTICKMFKKLHFIVVDTGGEVQDIDLEFRAVGNSAVFAVKILESVADLSASTVNLDHTAAPRLIIIASNTSSDNMKDGRFVQQDFSTRDEQILRQNKMMAMTTTTLRMIFLLCTKKGIDPKLFLKLFQEHKGGVFRLEDYGRK